VLAALGCAIAFAGLCAWYSQLYFHNVVDDALISVRFAENFAQGRGLVFNPGERVEGYTNFLWLLVSALLYWPCRLLGIDIVHALVAATIASGAAVVALVVRLGATLWPGRVWPVAVAAGLTVLDGDFGVWAVLGLEKHFLVMWALLALWLSAKPAAFEAASGTARALAIGGCLLCVMLTRPDGGLFVAAFGLSQLIALAQPAETRGALRSFRAVALAGAVVVVGYGLYFAARYAYFGYPLPNTFYLKVGGAKFEAWARGVAYLKDFLICHAWVPLAAVFALLGLGRPIVRTLALWVGLHTLYITYVGGDFYPGHRFYVVLVAPLALLIGHGVFLLERVLGAQRESARWQRALPVAAVGLLLVGCVAERGFTIGPLRAEIERWGPTVENNRRFMLWLKANKPADATVLTGDIGSAGHYVDAYVYDYYGVIDPVIAHKEVPTLGQYKPGHEKVGSAQYFLPKKPTFMKYGYMHGDFERNGYYLRGDMPFDLGVVGLWMRDPLPAEGRFDAAGGFRFERRDELLATTGEAFADVPRRGAVPGQQYVTGQAGGYVSSYHRTLGDRATGTLRTPPFELRGDLLLLRVGGGHDPQRLRVDVRVGERVIASFTGRDAELLTRQQLPITAHRGAIATVEVRDEAKGPWGHLNVDEIMQWTRTKTAAR
jgi:hypothetical protein